MNYHVFENADQVVHAWHSLKEYSELGRPVHISLSGGSTRLSYSLIWRALSLLSLSIGRTSTSGGATNVALHRKTSR